MRLLLNGSSGGHILSIFSENYFNQIRPKFILIALISTLIHLLIIIKINHFDGACTTEKSGFCAAAYFIGVSLMDMCEQNV